MLCIHIFELLFFTYNLIYILICVWCDCTIIVCVSVYGGYVAHKFEHIFCSFIELNFPRSIQINTRFNACTHNLHTYIKASVPQKDNKQWTYIPIKYQYINHAARFFSFHFLIFTFSRFLLKEFYSLVAFDVDTGKNGHDREFKKKHSCRRTVLEGIRH